jgi:heme/copper-type cytochrome/quinol oxidase subunit 2
MGLPGVAAGLTSFVLMYLTNMYKVDVQKQMNNAEVSVILLICCLCFFLVLILLVVLFLFHCRGF